MPIYTLMLTDKKEVARSTFVYYFEKPSGFNFVPGQYGGFTLMEPTHTDDKGITRRFSLLSTPHDNHIALATRLQPSAYKKSLHALSIGKPIKFAGPSGNFTLHTDQQIPAVFIAGGIGITPFYSMIRHTQQMATPRELTLFYGNQRREDAAFLVELEEMSHHMPHFHFVPTLAEPDPDWQGATGFINHALIKKHVHDLSKPVFYICGSPAMVAALRETLDELGINADRISVEDFPGY